jgi:hypothetical protein
MSTNNKRDMEAFQEDDDEFEEDYKDGSSSNNTLLRKIRMLCQRCVENERLIKWLKMELRLSKSTARQTKRQIRNGYDWDGKEANFADSVSSFAKEYLFPRFKFLKDGWMVYDEGQDSFPTFVQGKVQIPEGAKYTDQWERVYMSNHSKYVSIRCNLNNEIQRTY